MVGLTGGIGSGKSVATARLAALGAVVIDADRIAREVVAPGTDGLAEIIRTFGDRVRTPDGSLDRAALGEIVFADDAARSRLESIVHPRVRARTAQLTAAAPADAVVVNDVPLLVEVGLAPTYHLVIVVETDRDIRVARLVRDRGMPAEQALQRIRAQADDARRRVAADVVLRNDSTLAELHGRIDALWQDRLVPYERNLRQRRVARTAGAPVPAAPDPTWPAQFDRLAARIRHATGRDDLRIDHVGATAVPGLPAPDVIEIQLTIGTQGGDGAAGTRGSPEVDRLAERLAETGFPPCSEPQGEPAGQPGDVAGGSQWRHGSADPGRPVDLYLRPAGTPAWRYALLVRDHLRADLARGLRRASAESPAGSDPGAVDGRGVDDERRRAEEWAAATGWRP